MLVRSTHAPADDGVMTIMYWIITPYHTRDADRCVMPAEDEADHQAALKYAQSRIEDGWDQIKPGRKATVTITLHEGNMPPVFFNPDCDS